MNEILAKLQEGLVLVQKKEKELDGLLRSVNETAGQQKELSLKLTAKQAELDGRETAVKDVEDVVKLSQETKILADQTNDALKELAVQRKAFEESQARVAKEQSLKGQELAGKEDAIIAKEKDVADREAKLEQLITDEVKKILKK